MFPQTLAVSHNKQTSKLAPTNITKAEREESTIPDQ